MEMSHLTSENCPTCGSRTVLCRKPRQHVNGKWMEFREYECGLYFEYIPTFGKVEAVRLCSKSPEHIEKHGKRKQAVVKLEAALNSIDVDNDFKQVADRHIRDLKSLYNILD